MLELPNVTLCCIDTRDHTLALRAIDRSREHTAFSTTHYFTDAIPNGCSVTSGIEVQIIAPITSLADYSLFVIKHLRPYIQTDFALIIQWDGYIVHPECWTSKFLDYDYIGAPWDNADGTRSVGNGGFSLRSRRLLNALQDPRIAGAENEDVLVCGRFRGLLEREHGIQFGDPEIADAFSFEMKYKRKRTFGFHGIFNFAFVEPSENIAALAPLLSARLLGDPFIEYLLLNCELAKKWGAIVAIGERILSLQPGRSSIANLVGRARCALEFVPHGSIAQIEKGKND